VRALDGVTDWLLEGGYPNVLVEIANETNYGYDHQILHPDRAHELIARVRERSEERLLVSTSFTGGRLPPTRVLEASNFVLLHGNRQGPADIREMVDQVRAQSAFAADPKPVVFNEDSTSLANLEAAVAAGASWGYYDKGDNNYRDGFQAPPTNWSVNTPEKLAFFERVAELTGMALGG
ncbi:MAG: hypothetical protein ACRDVM_10155, partial [Acidimicrobiia bacterium]